LVLLASCGFQLSGVQTVPPEMAKTFIATDDRHSDFYQRLERGLQNSGVELVDSPDDATAVFSVLEDDTGQRVLSVSARNVPREYEVYYTVHYDVQASGTALMPMRTQTMTRDYIWDETRELGKEKEERLLREALADDLVRIILFQLARL